MVNSVELIEFHVFTYAFVQLKLALHPTAQSFEYATFVGVQLFPLAEESLEFPSKWYIHFVTALTLQRYRQIAMLLKCYDSARERVNYCVQILSLIGLYRVDV